MGPCLPFLSSSRAVTMDAGEMGAGAAPQMGLGSAVARCSGQWTVSVSSPSPCMRSWRSSGSAFCLHQQVARVYFVPGHLDAQGLIELDTARTHGLTARQPVAKHGRRAEHPRPGPGPAAAESWSITTEEIVRPTHFTDLSKVIQHEHASSSASDRG